MNQKNLLATENTEKSKVLPRFEQLIKMGRNSVTTVCFSSVTSVFSVA
jgi:hypothetical protein